MDASARLADAAGPCARALPVVVLDRVLHRAHTREVALDVTNAVILPELLLCSSAERRLDLSEVPALQKDDHGAGLLDFWEDCL